MYRMYNLSPCPGSAPLLCLIFNHVIQAGEVQSVLLPSSIILAPLDISRNGLELVLNSHAESRIPPLTHGFGEDGGTP